MADNRQEGEQDLADLIDSLYWDAIPEEAMERPGAGEALDKVEQQVRDLLEEHGANCYFDDRGNVRRQEG